MRYDALLHTHHKKCPEYRLPPNNCWSARRIKLLPRHIASNYVGTLASRLQRPRGARYLFRFIMRQLRDAAWCWYTWWLKHVGQGSCDEKHIEPRVIVLLSVSSLCEDGISLLQIGVEYQVPLFSPTMERRWSGGTPFIRRDDLRQNLSCTTVLPHYSSIDNCLQRLLATPGCLEFSYCLHLRPYK